jgi:hypothetical protein
MNKEQFSRGMGMVFHGLGLVFESLGNENPAVPEMGTMLFTSYTNPEGAAEPCNAKVDSNQPKAESAQSEAESAQPSVKKTKEKKAKEKKPEEDAPILTYDQVVGIVTKRVNKAKADGDEGFSERLRGVLTQMGYAKVSEIPAEKYEDFVTSLSFL